MSTGQLTSEVLTGQPARISEPYVVAIANQKGGCGKSLLSMGLAAVTADANGRAFLVDIDEQSTTAEVAERAEKLGNELPFDYTADTNPANLAKLRKIRGVDMILVDCPGSLEGHEILHKVLEQADFVIIPYMHDPFYLTPTRRTAAICAEQGVPHRVLINKIDTRRGGGVALLENAMATIDKLHLPRFRSFVREYVAHSQAHVEGLMITQYRGDKNAVHACEDIRRVHTELLMQLPKKGA